MLIKHINTSFSIKMVVLSAAALSLATLACSFGGGPAVPTSEPTATEQPITVPTLIPVETSVLNGSNQNNPVPTLASGNTGVSNSASLPGCPSLTPRLFVGASGRVTPGDPNVLRTQATRDKSVSTVIGQIPAGGTFVVVSGPQCADGFYWWQVSYNNLVGWTPEGDNTTYWLEPLTTVTPDCPGVPPSIMAIGMHGVVTPGDPNILRSSPAKMGTNIIGQIPAGGTFIIIGGPQCADGLRFWQVTFKTLTGWTADGQGSSYWLMPQS